MLLISLTLLDVHQQCLFLTPLRPYLVECKNCYSVCQVH